MLCHELPPASAGGTHVYQQNLIKYSKRDKFILVLGLLKQRYCSVELPLASAGEKIIKIISNCKYQCIKLLNKKDKKD